MISKFHISYFARMFFLMKDSVLIFYLIYIGRFSKLPGYPHQVLALLCAFFFYP